MFGTLEFEIVAISNFILGSMLLFLSGVFFAGKEKQNTEFKLYKYFVLLTGISAMIGGITHGFLQGREGVELIDVYVKHVNWSILALSGLLLIILSTHNVKRQIIQKLIIWAGIIGYLLMQFSLFYIKHSTFMPVNIYYGFALIFCFYYAFYRKNKNLPLLKYLFFVIVSILIQTSHITIFTYINYNTLMHLVLIGNVYYCYQAGIFIKNQKKIKLPTLT